MQLFGISPLFSLVWIVHCDYVEFFVLLLVQIPLRWWWVFGKFCLKTSKAGFGIFQNRSPAEGCLGLILKLSNKNWIVLLLIVEYTLSILSIGSLNNTLKLRVSKVLERKKLKFGGVLDWKPLIILDIYHLLMQREHSFWWQCWVSLIPKDHLVSNCSPTHTGM